MKATGRADLAANEKVLDLYTSNLQLEEQLQGVRRQVNDAKGIAEKVCWTHLDKAPLTERTLLSTTSMGFITCLSAISHLACSKASHVRHRCCS